VVGDLGVPRCPFWPTQFLIGPVVVVIVLGFVVHRYRQRTELTP
jgi:hypothetical protein